jgi:hypothetical protein
MKDGLSRKRLEELYLPPAGDFTLVHVPELKFIMIDGKGSPNGEAFEQAVQWLFATVYPIKRIAKERMGRNFVEPPLEGLWWADDMADFVAGKRDKLKWRLMIPAFPEWMDQDMFARAVAEAGKKRGDAPRNLRMDLYDEGRSVQIMHVGPPSEAVSTLVRMHGEFLPEHGLTPSGPHHEIYLNDPRRTAPEKLRTVFRQPVRSLSAARCDA